MAEQRVEFDFHISFTNGGDLTGTGFRLDIDGDSISDSDLARLLVADLRLLMVGKVEITNKSYIDEPHKRPTPSSATFIDLSHPIRDQMITYPGLPGPRITTHMSREESRAHYSEGVEFHIGAIEMVANTGTYLDSPAHRYADGVDIAGLPLDRLVGIPGTLVRSERTAIGPEAFARLDIEGRAVLIHTGWDQHFGTDVYLGGHPHLTEEGARHLVTGKATVVGIDSSNIDDTNDGARPAHSLLLGAGIPVVEHLTNLDLLAAADEFELTVLPAPVVGLGTFPVRAVARIGARTV